MALQSGWNFKPQKKSAEPPEFTGHQLRTLDVEMFLDASDIPQGTVAPHDRPAVLDRAPDVDVADDPKRRSRRSSCSRGGRRKPFTGVVKSVNVTMTLFRPTGLPVRATCKVSLQEFDPPLGGQNPTSGALRSTTSHQVRLGDSLASIANLRYGEPNLWRAIASVNEHRRPLQPAHRRRPADPRPRRRRRPWPDDAMPAQRSSNVFEITVGGTPLPDGVASALLEATSRTRSTCPTRSSSCSATRCAPCSAPAGSRSARR